MAEGKDRSDLQRYPLSAVPQSERSAFEAELNAAMSSYSPPANVAAYGAAGLTVAGERTSPIVTELAAAALRDKRPFSAVRIGDGESNLTAFEMFPGYPNLDRYVAEATIWQQEDSFLVDETWIVCLREMVVSSYAQADLLGVLGLAPFPGASQASTSAANRFSGIFERKKRPRGLVGQFRARQLCRQMAESGAFAGKTIATAHFYLGVVRHLDALMAEAERVLLVTSRPHLAQVFARRFDGPAVSAIHVGRGRRNAAPTLAKPTFLAEVYEQLPADMAGTLCLIGAGVWKGIYASWVKQRGGVAVDIGSGFDLLDGEVTRPFHRALPETERDTYRLVKPASAPNDDANAPE